MESTTSIDQVKAKSTDNPVIYRAVGWVAGTYQPSEDKIHQGIFVTEDGLTIPAKLLWRLLHYLKRKHPGVCGTARLFPLVTSVDSLPID